MGREPAAARQVRFVRTSKSPLIGGPERDGRPDLGFRQPSSSGAANDDSPWMSATPVRQHGRRASSPACAFAALPRQCGRAGAVLATGTGDLHPGDGDPSRNAGADPADDKGFARRCKRKQQRADSANCPVAAREGSAAPLPRAAGRPRAAAPQCLCNRSGYIGFARRHRTVRAHRSLDGRCATVNRQSRPLRRASSDTSARDVRPFADGRRRDGRGRRPGPASTRRPATDFGSGCSRTPVRRCWRGGEPWSPRERSTAARRTRRRLRRAAASR